MSVIWRISTDQLNISLPPELAEKWAIKDMQELNIDQCKHVLACF